MRNLYLVHGKDARLLADGESEDIVPNGVSGVGICIVAIEICLWAYRCLGMSGSWGRMDNGGLLLL